VTGSVVDWTKTQDGTPVEQLECGVRSYDWRPKLTKDGDLVMHHGDVTVPYPMKSAVREMVAWCNANPADEDLVVMYLWDCAGGDACLEAANNTLLDEGVRGIVYDAGDLQTLTIKDALVMSALDGGGHLLVLFNTGVDQNYNSTLTCSGYKTGVDRAEVGPKHGAPGTEGLPAAELEAAAAWGAAHPELLDLTYTCYNNSDDRAIPFTRMWDYVERTARSPPPASGFLVENQVLWQETAESVSIGTLAGSSLLRDEYWSDLNKLLAARLWSLPHISLLEVNAACDGGKLLHKLLRELFPLDPPDTTS